MRRNVWGIEMSDLVQHNQKTIKAYIADDEKGKILLPNFQRKFVWTPDQQKKLISSLLAGVPIGSVLLLKSPTTDMAVRQLCFDRLMINPDKNSERQYLLDGQQRFSSIKNAFSDVCSANNWEELKSYLPKDLQIRWFLKIDDDDFGVKNASFTPEYSEPNHYKEKLYYSGREDEKFWDVSYKEDLMNYCRDQSCIPLWKIQDGFFIRDLLMQLQYQANPKINKEKRQKWVREIQEHLKKRMLHTKIPNIEIDQSAMDIAIAVFEQVNTSGTKLGVLDLIAAKMAKVKNQPLLDLMEKFLYKKQSYFNEKKWAPLDLPPANQKFWDKETPASSFESAYVNCLAIKCYMHINLNDRKAYGFTKENLKKEQLYKLDGKIIKECWESTLKDLIYSYAFLVERCGVVKFSDIQYRLMLLPIFTVITNFTHRTNNNERMKKKVFDRLEYWYWRSIFDGKYQTRQNERAINDIRKIFDLCIGEKSKGLNDFEFDDENNFLMDRQDFSDFDAVSLIGKGVNKRLTRPMLQFMLSLKPLDVCHKDKELTSWEKLQGANIHKDHILPIGDRRNNKEDRFHSALMQTYLLSGSNQDKSDNTYDLLKYFNDSIIRKKHLIADNIAEIGQEFYKCNKEKECEDKIAEQFMHDRHGRFRDTLKERLRELKKSFN